MFFSFQSQPTGFGVDEDFKRSQLSNVRVLNAYEEKIDSIDNWLLAENISMNNYEVLIRAFKKEDEVELWVKGYDIDTFALFRTYRI